MLDAVNPIGRFLRPKSSRWDDPLLIINNPFIGETKMETENKKINHAKLQKDMTEEEYWGTCMVCGEEICANEEQRKRQICGFCYLADDEGTK